MLLLEGGVGGHMSHLYDNPSLTFKQMKEVLMAAAAGELIGTEKTDGQNLFVSYSIPEGRAKAARNGTHVKKGGLTPEEIAHFFGGRGPLEKTFSESFRAFEEAIEDLSDEEKEQIFGPDTNIYYSAEVIDPRSTNVINYYDTKTLAIHRAAAAEFDKETGKATERDVSQNVDFLARALETKQNELQTKDYKVEMDAIQGLAGLEDGSILANTLDRLEEVISAEGISDNQTVLEYMIARIMTLLVENGIELDPETEKKVVKRILFSNKGYLGAAGYDKMPADINLKALLKSVPEEQRSFLRSIIDPKDAKEYLKQAIWPLEDVIHDFSVEMLRGLESLFVLDNGENISHKEVERLRGETAEAIAAIENSGNKEAMVILQKEMEKLKDIENVSTAAEGFVFEFDGHTYKFTGNFAPMNQLLGLFKYGRGTVPALKKIDKEIDDQLLHEVMSILLEKNEPRTVVLYPGRFQPMGKHHLAVFKELEEKWGTGNVFIITSDKVNLPKSPLNFEEKKQIMLKHGIPEEQILFARSPYRGNELDKYFDPENTVAIYTVGKKDMDEDPRFANLDGVTKGGDPAWYRDFENNKDNLETYNKHGYVMVSPHISMNIPGFGEMCGTTIRACLQNLTPEVFEDLMGWYDEDLYEMVKEKIKSGDMDLSERIFGIIDEVLNEIYRTKDCEKKDGSDGDCEVEFGDGHTACYDSCGVAKMATSGELDEMHAGTFELPSRYREEEPPPTPGKLAAAAKARMIISYNKAVEKQKEKDRLSAKFNKRTLEEDELEEISSSGGGAAMGSSGGAAGPYSLPLGAKPSFFKDEHPKVDGTMPGIKLIYKRRDTGN